MKKVKNKLKFIFFYGLYRLGAVERFIHFLQKRFVKVASLGQTSAFDDCIEEIYAQMAPKLPLLSGEKPKGIKLVYLASKFYEHGGHTEWQRRVHYLLKDKYEQSLIITNAVDKPSRAGRPAPQKIQEASSYLSLCSLPKTGDALTDITALIHAIDKETPSVLIANIHPNDVYASIALKHLQQTSQVKLLYFNHADHLPNLAHRFADKILSFRAEPINLLDEHKPQNKVLALPLSRALLLPKEPEAQAALKHALGVESGQCISFSGGNRDKFFDATGHSEQICLVLNQLEKHPSLTHIFMSNLQSKQQAYIARQIAKRPASSNLKKRFICLPLQEGYQQYLGLADIYIDSFPLNGATMYAEACAYGLACPVWLNASEIVAGYRDIFAADAYIKETQKAYVDCLDQLLTDKSVLEQAKAAAFQHYQLFFSEEAFLQRIEPLLTQQKST